MARTQGQVIADSLNAAVGYGERLLKDVTPQQFARYAAPGGQVIESNHPAFVYGHLSLYGPRMIGQLGLDAGSMTPSEQFQTLFNANAQCQDDPTGTIYPALDQIVEAFRNGSRAAIDALRQVDDAVLQQPNPVERMLERFPTLGSLQAFYAGAHNMMHLGQISAWRRMMGLGSA